jgi:hypothetical protein
MGLAGSWMPLSVDGETTPLTTVTNALLVNVNDETLIRFTPVADYHGIAELSFVAWDGSRVPQRSAGGRADATYLSATGAFSENAGVFKVTVQPVNDAPVISNIAPVVLIPIIEDDLLQDSSWNDVSDIVASIGATDVDGSDVLGLAIIAAYTDSNGDWQYSVDSGATWINIADDVNPTAALLLSGQTPGDSYIRFVPAPDYSGDVSLSLIAWDESSLDAGTVRDISDPDFTTGPFSEVSTTATLDISPINDSPILLRDTDPEIMVEDIPTFKGQGLSSHSVATLFPTEKSLGRTTVYKDGRIQ